MMIQKRLFVLMTMLVMGFGWTLAQNADQIVGMYSLVSDVTGEASKVKIYKGKSGYEAVITWLAHPNDKTGKPKKDSKNPDAKLRNRTIVGTVIMTGLSFDSDDREWSGGKIYDPATGKSYKVVCKFENSKTLKVRGYIGIPTLGRTVLWTKIQ